MSNRHQFYVEVEAAQTTAKIDQESARESLQPGQGQAHNYSGTSTAARALRTLNMDLVEIFDQVKSCIDLAAERLSPEAGGPAETEIEFGIKISAEGNIVVATVGSEVHLKVLAKWKRQE